MQSILREFEIWDENKTGRYIEQCRIIHDKYGQIVYLCNGFKLGFGVY